MQKSKIKLRKKFINIRGSLKGKKIKEEKLNINLKKIINPSYPAISMYYPVRSEVSLLNFASYMHKNNHQIALPEILRKKSYLHFRVWKKDDRLKMGKFNILIPEKNLYIVPRVLLIPMVAFDKNKSRLGYGGGYYDRTISFLQKNNNIITIGIAFDEQESKKIPEMKYDKKMDIIVTQSRIII